MKANPLSRKAAVADDAPGLMDLGGTLRTRSAEETLALIRPHFERCGITRLANVTGLDTVGIPIWMSIRPAARSMAVQQGMGTSDPLAMASAAMDSIEMYHGERCVPVGARHSIGEALRSKAFVDPRLIPLRSEGLFRESRVVSWVDARDYLTGKTIKVPREMMDRDGLVEHHRDRLFHSSTNGLASGNTRDEAILHGLCEVVERDQVAFWTVLEGLVRPTPNSRVDLSTVDDPVCAELIERIRRAGLELAVWNAAVTSDVPTFFCSTWDERRKTRHPTRERGHGTHPYKRIALARAILESIQSRVTPIAGSRDDLYWSVYGDFLDVAAPSHQAFIRQTKLTSCDVDYCKIPEAPAQLNLRSLLSWLVARVQSYADTRCLVVDLSGPELPVSVVHVVAPGLDVKVQKPGYTPSHRMMRYLVRQGLL